MVFSREKDKQFYYVFFYKTLSLRANIAWNTEREGDAAMLKRSETSVAN